MRRILFAVIVLAALVIPAGAAFAEEPRQATATDAYFLGQWFLGEPFDISVAGFFYPGERADAWLTRPSTCDVWDFDYGYCVCADYDFVNDVCLNLTTMWPLVNAPIGGPGGAAWWVLPSSETRRMSYAEDPNLVANQFGIWSASFMLPRDEVWYPCSFPLKWKCNFEIAPDVWQYHSPVTLAFDPLFPSELRFWPWLLESPLADPKDIISPLWIDIANYSTGFGFVDVPLDLEITGYGWRYSDIP